MAGLLEFAGRFGTDERCIEHLAGLRWRSGFVCAGCGGRQAWRLKARPRVYECTACHRQESVTAGTVLHRTRTDLAKWFVAAYLMGRDKRGVSAKFLQQELAVAYQSHSQYTSCSVISSSNGDLNPWVRITLRRALKCHGGCARAICEPDLSERESVARCAVSSAPEITKTTPHLRKYLRLYRMLYF